MAATKQVTAVQASWLNVEDSDMSYCFLQLRGDGPILVQVADSQPNASSEDGILLWKEGLMDLPIPNLTTSNRVWVRSLQNEGNAVAAFYAT